TSCGVQHGTTNLCRTSVRRSVPRFLPADHRRTGSGRQAPGTVSERWGAAMERLFASAVRGSGRAANDGAWVRWGAAAAVIAMVAWVVGVALIPLDAKLDRGDQHLAQVLRAHTVQLYAAALLAIVGAVLLAGFFAVLTRLVPQGYPGWGLL